MVLLLVVLALVALAAVLLSRPGAQPAFEFRLRPNPTNRLDIFKWLAVLPLVPAGPLLLFGLTWFVPGLFGLGLVFVAGAILIWRFFAREWPVVRTH